MLASRTGIPGLFFIASLKDLSRQDLRNAIVMKEILDLPLGLRESGAYTPMY